MRWTDEDVSGLPVVEAARLVDVAHGGQVLCTDLVRRLAQGRGQHEFKDLGPVPAKGLVEPLQVCELLWQSSDRDPDDQVPPWLKNKYLLPFVGRSEELESLDDALRGARFGTRMIVLKGRREPARRAWRRSWPGRRSGRVHRAGRPVHRPAASGVSAHRRRDRMAQPRVARAAAAGRRRRAMRTARAAGAVPCLTAAGPVRPPAADPLSDRYQMLASLRVLVKRLTDIRPVLFVIDDLHWATPESIEMVRSLSHDTEGLSLLILVTARPVAVESAAVTARGLRKLEAESRRSLSAR